MVQSTEVQTPAFLVEREVRIQASPETVFEFFTDPEKMVRWKGFEAELDPRPGGTYRVTVVPQGVAAGQYLRVEPPHLIAFSWGWEGGHPVAPGTSVVEITLTPDAGATILRLRHSNLPSAEMAEEHAKGWDHYFGRLEIAAAGGDPGPDPNLIAQAQ